jgi:hypothetical protein
MKKFKFKAKIQPGEGGGAYLVFPFDTEKEFGTKGKVSVHATLDGVPERSALFRYGPPQHLLAVRKAIRDEIGKKPGDTVDVVLWKDEEIRTLEVPAEFKTRMEQEKLLPFFETLSYTHRKEYCRWITEAKKEETRQNRLAKAIEMLRKGVKTPG